MELILGILGIIIWLMVTTVIMSATVTICMISLFVGAIGGVCIGFVKGIINYFASVREELTFDRYE